MSNFEFILYGPDVRLAGDQLREALNKIVQDVAYAIEDAVILFSPRDKSNLANAWDVRFEIHSGILTGYVFNPVKYIWYLIEGTGIYGPYGQSYWIFPKEKQALAFNWKGKDVIFANVLHPGIKGHDFVKDALEDVKDEIDYIVRDILGGWYVQTPIQIIR